MSDGDSENINFVRPVRVPAVISFAADPPTVDVEIAWSALVIVDMQNDFLHENGWFPANGIDPSPLSEVVVPIASLAAASRDAGMPIIWVNWGVRPDRANLPDSFVARATSAGTRPTYGDPYPSGQGRILVRGDWGANVVEGLSVEADDVIVSKHRPSGFPDTELDSGLRLRDLTTLFFAGVNIDRCVLATLIDACSRGYDCVLVDDACATTSLPYMTNAVCHIVRLLYGVTANSSDIKTALAATSPIEG
ncbi:MAG: isochorismatase [Rhodospirillaceae bacterium]|nr:isochorismatase [Rhodospirillaceae bacterium]